MVEEARPLETVVTGTRRRARQFPRFCGDDAMRCRQVHAARPFLYLKSFLLKFNLN
jgi:hypothetical protein